MVICQKSSTDAFNSSCCPSNKVKSPTVNQRATTTYTLFSTEKNDIPKAEERHEV
jgi:hypothetical protein